MKPLPDLHQRAFTYKNHRRLKHDGGRSWIKDSQLYDARQGVNSYAVSTSAGTGAANKPAAIAATDAGSAAASKRLAEGTGND